MSELQSDPPHPDWATCNSFVMVTTQIIFLALTAIIPAALWHVSRTAKSERLDRNICRVIAALLLAVYVGDVAVKIADGEDLPARVLPMHLCDWALLSVCGALLFRSQLCFDLAYFWGLGGTLQALFTPDIDSTLAWWRIAGFFIIHAGIIIGVLHKMLALHYRPWPRSLLRVIIASGIYIVTALTVNHLTGGNYGFLTHRPLTPTLLDHFSNTRWIYLLQLNLVAIVMFFILYLPWWARDRMRPPRRSGRSDASELAG